MRTLDLFSGIGGFSLGLERAGFKTVAFCEIDPFCRRVLARHWPDVPHYDDIATLSAARLAADGIGRIDAICGGFPCQDISLAGSGLGLDGERSGLWREYARLIREVRPRFVFVENVSALLGRGLGDVLGDLAALGYDALWNSIPAAAVGAPHRRDRLWIVAAYAVGERWKERAWGKRQETRRPSPHGCASPDSDQRRVESEGPVCAGRDAADVDAADDPDADRAGLGSGGRGWMHGSRQSGPVAASGGETRIDPDTDGRRRESGGVAEHGDEQGAPGHQPDGLGEGGRRGRPADDPDARGIRLAQWGRLQRSIARQVAAASAPWDWSAEHPFRRVDDGVRKRVERSRLKALGNAVVPQIPEILGRAVMEAFA